MLMRFTHDKTLIFDVDGVLLNWMSNLPIFCRSVGLSAKGALKVYSSSVHESPCVLFDTDDEELAKELCKKYNESRYGRYLPAYQDAVRVLPLLAEKYNIICLSSFGNTTDAWLNRRCNLEAFFPDCITDLVIIPHMNKLDELRRIVHQEEYYNRTVVGFVDDQSVHWLEGVEILGEKRTFLLNRNLDDSIDHVHNFDELFNLLEVNNA